MRNLIVAVAGAVAIILGGAAIALASIPDSHGIIHGCYTVKTGTLRVIDTGKGQKCATGQHALNWNQKGPQGPAGPAGVSGYAVARCTIGVDASGSYYVVSSSGGMCTASGSNFNLGQAELVCASGDGISATSDTVPSPAAGNGFESFDPMLNANDTGYQFGLGGNPGVGNTTSIEVVCANVS